MIYVFVLVVSNELDECRAHILKIGASVGMKIGSCISGSNCVWRVVSMVIVAIVCD